MCVITTLEIDNRMGNRWIYHLSRKDDWVASEISDFYDGSVEDSIDGYLHFSTAKQVEASANKHRKGEKNLLLLEVDTKKLKNSDLRWEQARQGELFPHIYGSLDKLAVTRVFDLPINNEGKHVFPLLKDENL